MKGDVLLGWCMINIRKSHEIFPMDVLLLADPFYKHVQEYLQRSIFYTST